MTGVVAILLACVGAASVLSALMTPVGVRRRVEPFLSLQTPTARTRLPLMTLSVWLAGVFPRSATMTAGCMDLAKRLERAAFTLTVQQYRSRQVLAGFGAVMVAALTGVVLSLPPTARISILLGLPAAALWVSEQVLLVASRRRSEAVLRELPLVVEQLAGLLKNGVGIAEACTDVAHHTGGLVAGDLARIAREIAHGVPIEVALHAWADRHDEPAIRRLVAVLDVHRHAADLGGLLAQEVRELRRHTHRELLRVIQQREQQVWIPVTVATLVPGVLLLGVPFVYTLAAVLG